MGLIKRRNVDVDKEIERLERKEKRRKRDDGEEDLMLEDIDQGDGTVRAIKRAAQKRNNRRRTATTKYSRSRSHSSNSDEDSDEF